MSPVKKRNHQELRIIALLSVSILFVLAAAVLCERLLSIASIHSLSSQFASMDYSVDYELDELLASGADSDAALLRYISRQIFFDTAYAPASLHTPAAQCSTFTASAPDGEHLMGHNCGDEPTPVLLLKTAPTGGYRSISLTALGILGIDENTMPAKNFRSRLLTLAAPYLPMDGVNEKGLAVSIAAIPGEPIHQQRGKPAIHPQVALRMLLDKCADVDEAVALLEEYDMQALTGRAHHFLLADASGKSIAVEYPGNQLTVFGADCITNFSLHAGRSSGSEDATERYLLMKRRLIGKNDTLTDAECMELLSDARCMDAKPPKTSTQWSVVYHLDSGRTQVAIHQNYDLLYGFGLH